MIELQGLKALEKQLNELPTAVSGKLLKSAVRSAMLPAEKAMKMAAPIGTEAHRTFKGNLVAPGFLRRNIKRKVILSKRTGKVIGLLGVRPEAYYGVQYVEKGTKKMPAKPWFKNTFIAQESAMLQRLKDRLRANLEKQAAKK